MFPEECSGIVIILKKSILHINDDDLPAVLVSMDETPEIRLIAFRSNPKAREEKPREYHVTGNKLPENLTGDAVRESDTLAGVGLVF